MDFVWVVVDVRVDVIRTHVDYVAPGEQEHRNRRISEAVLLKRLVTNGENQSQLPINCSSYCW